MNLLIATDIFGKTPALEALADQISSSSGLPLIVDPYGGVAQHFDTEPAAYTAFQASIGLERYTQMVSAAIQDVRPPLLLIGFSVGASAIWALSGELTLPAGTRAVCFYGSQIRHFIDVNPRIEMEMFLAQHESHFDVAGLMAKMALKKGVTCHRTPYLHCFMNQLSVNFDPIAYARYRGILLGNIKSAAQGE